MDARGHDLQRGTSYGFRPQGRYNTNIQRGKAGGHVIHASADDHMAFHPRFPDPALDLFLRSGGRKTKQQQPDLRLSLPDQPGDGLDQFLLPLDPVKAPQQSENAIRIRKTVSGPHRGASGSVEPESFRVHTTENRVQPLPRHPHMFREIPGHDRIGRDYGISRPRMQHSVRPVAARQTLISPRAYQTVPTPGLEQPQNTKDSPR